MPRVRRPFLLPNAQLQSGPSQPCRLSRDFHLQFIAPRIYARFLLPHGDFQNRKAALLKLRLGVP